ncbi:MAG: hypothetical protein HY036_01760 [Nitrospirae bacterium]|nr:hypothetical protein [Nitrospirota bacterium]MBI3351282.1 hypothetical protein [Nitrospirota bacterium]
MGFYKIKELTSRIDSEVNFGAPQDISKVGGKPMRGTIVDEVWADPEINKKLPRPARNNQDWGDYSFCSQHIKWDDGSYSIRLAYYRRRAGEDHWEYASQMTVNSEWRTIKSLLEKTLGQKQWFQDEHEE